MEQYAHKDLAFAIFRKVLSESEFRDWPDVGIVAQAYLPETEEDLRALDAWVRAPGTPVTVRLVKGAYWDYEVVHARQLGWREPVYLQKWQSDASYERCARFLMEHHERLRPALASHNVRSLAAALAAAEAYRRAAARLRDADAPRHGRADPASASWPTATGCGSTRLMGRSCRAWLTWCAGCWKTRRTIRS